MDETYMGPARVLVHVGYRYKMFDQWIYITGTDVDPKDVLGDHYTFEKVYVLA